MGAPPEQYNEMRIIHLSKHLDTVPVQVLGLVALDQEFVAGTGWPALVDALLVPQKQRQRQHRDPDRVDADAEERGDLEQLEAGGGAIDLEVDVEPLLVFGNLFTQ